MNGKLGWKIVLLVVAACGLLAAPGGVSAQGERVRVRNLVRIKGANANPLMGYGLVVGLSGTGDSSTSTETQRLMGNLLRSSGVRLDDQRLKMRNVAAVVVTCNLPAFAQAGDALDVLVSSMGDAKSLRGGTLLMTRLEAADGTGWAMAQGPVSTGQDGAVTGRTAIQTVAGRVPGGGLVLRDMTSPLTRSGRLTLVLREPDFATAQRLAELVRRVSDGATVRVVNPSVVEVTLASADVGQEGDLMARLGELELPINAPARVVVNERTGTIVMGGQVHISPVAISHGSLKVRVQNAEVELAGRIPPGNPPRERSETLRVVHGGGTLQDVVDALNALGASPTELIQVLQAIKQAGALNAELEIQ